MTLNNVSSLHVMLAESARNRLWPTHIFQAIIRAWHFEVGIVLMQFDDDNPHAFSLMLRFSTPVRVVGPVLQANAQDYAELHAKTKPISETVAVMS